MRIAVKTFEESDLMKTMLGANFHSHYIAIKKLEWDEYNCQITDQQFSL